MPRHPQSLLHSSVSIQRHHLLPICSSSGLMRCKSYCPTEASWSLICQGLGLLLSCRQRARRARSSMQDRPESGPIAARRQPGRCSRRHFCPPAPARRLQTSDACRHPAASHWQGASDIGGTARLSLLSWTLKATKGPWQCSHLCKQMPPGPMAISISRAEFDCV